TYTTHGDVSAIPAVADGAVYFPDWGGYLNKVDAATGAGIWSKKISDYDGVPGSVSRAAPAVVGNTVYLGDQNGGYVFAVNITTGNNYTVPDSVKTCQANGGTAAQCLDPNDHVDSVMALDATTGQIKWSTGVQGFDDWNVSCIPGFDPNNCPSNPGPDFDFGSGPNLFTIMNSKGKKQLVVGAGQKSGQYWALDAGTGQILWSQAAGPGSTLGGIEWGPATDGKRIYVAEANFFGIPYPIPSGQTITSGSWAALDPATGQILWQVPDPSHNAFGGGNALGPVSVANGVLYAPSMSGDY